MLLVNFSTCLIIFSVHQFHSHHCLQITGVSKIQKIDTWSHKFNDLTTKSPTPTKKQIRDFNLVRSKQIKDIIVCCYIT